MYGYVTIRLHNEYHYYALRKLARVGLRLLPSTINGMAAEKEDKEWQTQNDCCLLAAELFARVSFLNTVFADNAYVHIIRIVSTY